MKFKNKVFLKTFLKFLKHHLILSQNPEYLLGINIISYDTIKSEVKISKIPQFLVYFYKYILKFYIQIN